MKIEYINKEENFDTFYNDYVNFNISYLKVLKGKKIDYYKNILKTYKIRMVWCFIAFLIFGFAYIINTNKILGLFLMIVTILYLLVTIGMIRGIIQYKKFYSQSKDLYKDKKCIVTINTKGIKDVTDGHEVLYSWDNLAYFVETKYNIFILDNNKRIAFYYPKEICKELKAAIKKYYKDLEYINFYNAILNIK